MLNIKLLAAVEGLLFGVSMFFFMLDRNGGPEGLRSRQLYQKEARLYHGPQSEQIADIHEEYPDLIGYLTVDGTAIDYPVMRDRTDSDGSYFYLSLNVMGQTDRAGCPFIRQSASLDNDILEVFAHNNSNGTMFADLVRFEDEDFFKEHGLITFDTVQGLRTYEVIAVIDVEVPSDEFTFFGWSNFDSESREEEFLSQIYAASCVNDGGDLTTGRQYLLLVTCEYSHVNGRRAVIAVRKS